MAKIKWEVEEAPVGRYRSFRKRGWPTGRTECNMFFAIRCADEYVPRKVTTGDHAPLKLAVRDDSARGSTMRVFAREFATLADLKAFAAALDLDKLRSKAA